MRSPQPIRDQRLKALLLVAVSVAATTLLLSAAESLTLERGKPKAKPARIYFSDPKGTAELPGPDQLQAPPSPLLNSLTPKTSQDSIAPPYVPSARNASKPSPDLEKNWMFGPQPTTQKEKDAEINRFFGIRDDSYDRIEKSSKSSRSDWLEKPSQPQLTRQQPRNKADQEDSDADLQKGEKRNRQGDRREEGIREANRSESLYKSLFSSERSESSSTAAALSQNGISLRDALNMDANSLERKDAQTKLDEFRKLLNPRPANSAFGISEPLATTGLESPRPVPLTPVNLPDSNTAESDPRRAFDATEFSGAGSRYRSPLFNDLNKSQSKNSDIASEAKPKAQRDSMWSQPTVLEIPRRKF
jgi:hypothetical protein